MADYPEDKKMFWSEFKEHTIQPDGDDKNSYIYRNPKRTMYLSFITFRHGFIVIYGDTGPFVFQTGSSDALDWAKKTVDDPHYVMGKLKGQQEKYDAKATFNSFIEQLKIIREDLIDHDHADVNKEEIKHHDEGLGYSVKAFEDEEEAVKILIEFDIDYCDYMHTSWDANPDAQWAYWILRTFIDKLEKTGN